MFSATPNTAYAENNRTFYAKVQSTGVQLCTNPSEGSGIFEIPYSYFVNVQYGVDDYFKVSYNGVDGFVKKDKVVLMNGTPTKPFAEATFNVAIPYELYKSPTSTSTSQGSITTSTNLTYYGTKSGEEVTDEGNDWYYCSAELDGTTQFGYVYSVFVQRKPTKAISLNTETFEIVSEDILLPNTTQFQSLSTGTKIILIVAIAVPSVLILYFLIKPSRIMQMSKQKQPRSKKNVTRKIHHGDYFEFDESEL